MEFFGGLGPGVRSIDLGVPSWAPCGFSLILVVVLMRGFFLCLTPMSRHHLVNEAEFSFSGEKKESPVA